MNVDNMHTRSESCNETEERIITTNNNNNNNDNDTTVVTTTLTTMVAKYGKQIIKITNLPTHSTTIGHVKQKILQETNILPRRQKFIGLVMVVDDDDDNNNNNNNNNNNRRRKTSTNIPDDCTLDKLQIKKPKECIYDTTQNPKRLIHAYHSFILMGTPEDEIFIDPDSISNGGNDVVNDFDLDFNIGSDEWKEHFVNRQNLIKFTNSTQVYIMNQPREGKKLMVLDLDHTLLDFSSKSIMNGSGGGSGDSSNTTTTNTGDNASTATNATNAATTTSIQDTINKMKRPFMDEFLSAMYQHYDLVVWSQTSWRWLETKLVELGMLSNPNYKFCFVLDKTSMFAITSTRKNGQRIKHYVKPLQIIWTKFPNIWNPSNTIHLDDLSRNFALNLDNGLKVTAYYRKKRRKKNGTTVCGGSGSTTRQNDVELLGLIGYCSKLAIEVDDFTTVDFSYWKDIVNGTKEFSDQKIMTKKKTSKEG